MKIRTRAFMLGLFPTLLLAAVLTTYHVYTRITELESTLLQQGVALARHLATSAEYGVISGNKLFIENLLQQAMVEPGVKSAMVVWVDQARVELGEPAAPIDSLDKINPTQIGQRVWFVHPVKLGPIIANDPFIETSTSDPAPLAWVGVSVDLGQKDTLIRQMLVTSLGFTVLGVALAILLIQKLALTGLQPLLDTISVMKRISSGHFGARVDIRAHSPELRELQSIVNQMSDSLMSFQQQMELKVQAVTAELAQKQKEAEQANLAKSKFLAAASHDLRQPMHAISLYVESLKFQMHGRKANDILEKIERSISGMVELFNAILDVTKLEAGAVQPQLAPIAIRRFFLDMAEGFSSETDRKGLSLRVHAPDILIESDVLLLERIFRNLLSNALRHTATGGILLSARHYKGQLRLQVWDTGSGIAPHDQLLVFEEFYQAESGETENRHGLGLGLSIVHRLVRLLGYPLQLRSIPGRGTVFSLDVPLMAGTPVRSETPDMESNAPLSGLVVIVDDEPAVLDSLGVLLQQWDLQVQVLNTLDQVRRQITAPPDVMLVDFQLRNGENGLMVAGEVHQRWGSGIPLVLITGDTRASTAHKLNTLGFPVMYKPIQPARLRSMLSAILAKNPPREEMPGPR